MNAARCALRLPSTIVVATRLRIAARAIRPLKTLWRGDRRRFGVFLENFFVAKFCDSESAKRDFRSACLSIAIDGVRAPKFACIREMPILKGFLACLTRDCLRFLLASHRGDSPARAHRLDRAAQLRSHTHQHFLKRHSGFFISLVYSNCSAFRIAGCTTLTSHLT